ncbi:MAG: MFS transporter [Bacillota bacterium]|nr:MFS transporter [Bacillota bacterium]
MHEESTPGHRSVAQDENPRLRYWAVMVSAFFASLGYGMVGPLLPLHARATGGSIAVAGLVMSALGLGRVVTNVAAGHAGDRYGYRPVIAFGSMAWAVVGVLYSQAKAADRLIPLSFAMGIGRGAQWTGLLASAVSLSTAKTRGRMLSVLSTFDILGYCPGPVIGGLLAERIGPGAPFLGLAVLEAIAGIIVLTLLREGRREKREAPLPGTGTAPSVTGERPDRLPRLFRLLAAGQFMILFGAAGTFGTIMPLIGVARCGLSASQVGGVLSLSLGLMLLSMQVAGRLFDAGFRWQGLAGGTAAGVAAMVVLAYARTGTAFSGAVALMVVASGFVYPVPAALAAGLFGHDRLGQVMGLLQTAGDAGSCIGPVALGHIVEMAKGDYAVPVLLHASIYSTVFVSLVAAIRRPQIPATIISRGTLRSGSLT